MTGVQTCALPIYYVLQRLIEEARTPRGKALAEREWSKVSPELVKLMGLPAGSDPLRTLGIPKPFR